MDNLQFDGSLGTSGIGKAGPARVEVAAAEEAEIPVLIFLSTVCWRCMRGRWRLGKRGKSVCRLEVG